MSRRWVMILLLLAGLTPRAEAHSEKALVCVRTYQGIEVDGKLDDWVRRLERSSWTAQLEVKKGETVRWMRAAPTYLNALISKIEAGNIADPDDFSAAVYTLWDPKALYVAAVVTDDQVVAEHDQGDIWQDDALEVWIDCRHNAVTPTLFQDDEYQLGFSPASQSRSHPVAWAWRNPATEPVIAAMRVASAATKTGYVIEASVPWSVLKGCQPAIGGMMGFNLSMVDKDADQLWTHVTWSGQLHSDPSQFGHLYFVDAPVDLFPSDVFETPDASVPEPKP